MPDFFLQNYNVLIVLVSTLILGAASGLVGCFLVLRKEALISDAVTHSTLPGIAIGFMISLSLGHEDGRYLPILLLCASITAQIGAYAVRFIIDNTRLSPDAAIASVMSFFYGFGLLLMSAIQTLSTGNKAGLGSFLLGQVAGLTSFDLMLIACISIVVVTLIALNFRKLALISFDPLYARLIDGQTKRYDLLLTFLMVLVVCAGLKTVGLILILALLILPAISARQLTKRCASMALLSAIIGAGASGMGVLISLNFADLPTGSTIILCAFGILVITLGIKEIRKASHA